MRVRDTDKIQSLLRMAGSNAPCVPDLAQVISETAALLEGHFRLQSGRHSSHFLRATQLVYRPAHSDLFATEMAKLVKEHPIDAILAPQAGSEFLAKPLAKHLDVECYLTKVDERRIPQPELAVAPANLAGTRVLTVSDVVTTGASHGVLHQICRERHASVEASMALAVLDDHWLEQSNRYALLRASWAAVAPAQCQACKRSEPLWPSYEFA